MTITTLDPYAGQTILMYDGPHTVLSTKESEPDGDGGKFVDVTFKAGDRSRMLPNLSTTQIEDMLVTLREVWFACPPGGATAKFRDTHTVRNEYRVSGNWDVYLDGNYFGTYWTG